MIVSVDKNLEIWYTCREVYTICTMIIIPYHYRNEANYKCFLSSAACSAPLNLVVQNVGETTVSLIWESSSISNGIIEEYRVREFV